MTRATQRGQASYGVVESGGAARWEARVERVDAQRHTHLDRRRVGNPKEVDRLVRRHERHQESKQRRHLLSITAERPANGGAVNGSDERYSTLMARSGRSTPPCTTEYIACMENEGEGCGRTGEQGWRLPVRGRTARAGAAVARLLLTVG